MTPDKFMDTLSDLAFGGESGWREAGLDELFKVIVQWRSESAENTVLRELASMVWVNSTINSPDGTDYRVPSDHMLALRDYVRDPVSTHQKQCDHMWVDGTKAGEDGIVSLCLYCNELRPVQSGPEATGGAQGLEHDDSAQSEQRICKNCGELYSGAYCPCSYEASNDAPD